MNGKCSISIFFGSLKKAFTPFALWRCLGPVFEKWGIRMTARIS
jgi:hypothetical protein